MIRRSHAIALIVLGVVKCIIGAIILLTALIGTSSNVGSTKSIIILVLIGIGYTIPGIVGIVAAVKKTQIMMKVYMNVCVFFVVLIGGGLILISVQIINMTDFFKNWEDHCFDNSSVCICKYGDGRIEIKASCETLGSSKFLGVVIFMAAFYCFAAALLLCSSFFSCFLYYRKPTVTESGEPAEQRGQHYVEFENVE